MKNFVIYDAESRAILSSGSMDEAHIVARRNSGECIAVVDAPVRDFKGAFLSEAGEVFYKAVVENVSFHEARSLEYPPIADFADAYYWKENGDPQKMQDYLRRVASVKAKHPKP